MLLFFPITPADTFNFSGNFSPAVSQFTSTYVFGDTTFLPIQISIIQGEPRKVIVHSTYLKRETIDADPITMKTLKMLIQ